MQQFYSGLAEILEIDPAQVGPSLDLTKLAWDSLAIVSTIALIDDCYNVMLSGQALGQCKTVSDIEALVAAKRTA
ncbi:acyl carrier protein [Bradyrhizobium sp.]|uniref:acyl carrier protein n=1 Tax=Bradyrhizobium sp. TaxID=376 RepID=UPI003C7132E2